VGPERVAGAVSLYEVILNLSRVLGPAIGGVLLALSGPAACVLVNALTFVAPLAVLLHYRRTDARRPRGSDPAHPARAGRPSALAGLKYAWSHPLLRACMLTGASCGVLFSPALFFPLLATRVFQMGASGYGLLLALFGIGALPGALLASRRQPSGRQVRVLGLVTGACVGISATAPALPVLFIGILGTGASSIWMVAAANTLVQLRAEPELRGRVMGAWTMALPGTIPITALIAGAAADLFGPRVAYAGVGAVIAGVALACWRAYAEPAGG
jgi:predicted MFS family arabinose efflux permease